MCLFLILYKFIKQFWILTLELIYQIQIIFSCNLSHFWNQHHWKPRINISHYLLWWYVSLSPPPLFTPGHALWGSHFILNKKLTSFLKSPLLKILELLYQIVFSGFNPPPGPLSPLRAPLMGCGGIRNRKEISYLKSSPLKALNLISYKIFFFVFFDFCRYGGGSGGFGGRTTAKTYFASNICCKHSPYQFSVKSDNSNSSFR